LSLSAPFVLSLSAPSAPSAVNLPILQRAT
jgi:hypothetical protein